MWMSRTDPSRCNCLSRHRSGQHKQHVESLDDITCIASMSCASSQPTVKHSRSAIMLSEGKALVNICKTTDRAQTSLLREVKVEVHLERTPKDFLTTIERVG